MLQKKQAPVLLILLLLSAVSVFVGRSYSKEPFSRVERFLLTSLLPVVRVTHGFRQRITNFISHFQKVEKLYEENKKLEAELSAQKSKNARLHEYVKRTDRLEKLLGFTKAKDSKWVLAEVILREPTRWFSGIVVNKGSESGIQAGQPVVTQSGLVGRIKDAGQGWAKVLLLLDNRSAVGALLQPSREIGVVSGINQEYLRFDFLPVEANVRVGDRVVTSGLGGSIPKGLPMGFVRKIEKQGITSLYVEIEPSVSFSTLEEVMVLTGENSEKKLKPK